jgi:hypothetical protein
VCQGSNLLGNFGFWEHVMKKVMRIQNVASLLLAACLAAFAQEPTPAPHPPAAVDSVAKSMAGNRAAPVSLSQDQIQAMIRLVAERDMENDKQQRDYTYVERVVENKLNGKGEIGSTETRTYDVLEIYNEQVRRLTSKDDKPLSAKDAEKEEAKIQKIIDKRKNESEGDRDKRLKREEKEREDDRRFVTEVADAFNFKLVGTESLDGRDTYVIDAEPRPGFEGKTREARILPKFRFRVWIDRAENQWVKLDAECIDTVSFGLFLARIHKGSRILIDTTRVNDEVWLPRHVAVHVDVRVALLKNFNVEQDVTYTEYKKFHSASRIVGMEEVK